MKALDYYENLQQEDMDSGWEELELEREKYDEDIDRLYDEQFDQLGWSDE